MSFLNNLICVIFSLFASRNAQIYGPYYFPTGQDTDPIFITFGEYNTSHFVINIGITGDYWFGFGFAKSGFIEGQMNNTDAIIFADFDGATGPTAQEYILGNHNQGSLQSHQDISSAVYIQGNQYSVQIRRPYDPSLYGERDSYTITYPFAGMFCWIWSQGSDILFTNPSHINKGYQCINFGGITDPPSPSPSYMPTPLPSLNPTNKPTKYPSTKDDTAHPSDEPTKEPINSPTRTPTFRPTTSAETLSPSKYPTTYPTISPTNNPTKVPTPQPTQYPSVKGDTAHPTVDPTKEPSSSSISSTFDPSVSPSQSTSEPTISPSKSPTVECPIGCLTFVLEGCNECRCNLDRGYESCVLKNECREKDESYCKQCNDEEKICINSNVIAKRVLNMGCDFEECVDGQGNEIKLCNVYWNVLLVFYVVVNVF